MKEQQELGWKNIMPEEKLLQGLGLNKQGLARLRDKGLPCIKLNRNCRAYIDTDVIAWLRAKCQEGRQSPRIGSPDIKNGTSDD